MTLIGVGFGVALVGAAVFSAISPQRVHASICTALLVAGWIVAVIVSPTVTQPTDLMVYPAMDVICGVIVANLWSISPARWKLAIVFCFMTQALVHAIFMTVSLGWGFNAERLYRYQLAINIVLGMQILCVSWPGIRNVVGIILDRLLPVPHVRRRVEASRKR